MLARTRRLDSTSIGTPAFAKSEACESRSLWRVSSSRRSDGLAVALPKWRGVIADPFADAEHQALIFVARSDQKTFLCLPGAVAAKNVEQRSDAAIVRLVSGQAKASRFVSGNAERS